MSIKPPLFSWSSHYLCHHCWPYQLQCAQPPRALLAYTALLLCLTLKNAFQIPLPFLSPFSQHTVVEKFFCVSVFGRDNFKLMEVSLVVDIDTLPLKSPHTLQYKTCSLAMIPVHRIIKVRKTIKIIQSKNQTIPVTTLDHIT